MNKTVKWASFLSVTISSFLMGLKFYAYSQTGSQAILSDALESIVNVTAAFFAFYVIRFISQPADEDHPYGHGKMEYFSAAFEGGLITFAGIVIGFHAVKALLLKTTLHSLEEGMGLVLFAGAGNLILGLYLISIAKKENSETLLASGQHLLSDVWSTVAVLVGLGLTLVLGWWWMDPLVAILIGLLLCFTGYKIIKRSLQALLDATDPQILDDLAKSFETHRKPGIIDIHLTKVIRSGNFHHVDCHLVVPEFWTIQDSHAIVDKFEDDVITSYPFSGEINFHLDPCQKKFCHKCNLSQCQIRVSIFEKTEPFTKSNLISNPNTEQNTP